jgi:hypothetical protein
VSTTTAAEPVTVGGASAARRVLLVRLLLVVVALAAASSFVVLRAGAVPGGLGSFPLVETGQAPGPLPPGVTTRRSGYDGQFYLRLAQDPFGDAEVSAGQRLDFPAYRQQRVGYPLLAWTADRLPAVGPTRALVLVNVLAVGAIAWFGSGLSRRAGRGSVPGALLALLPFTVVALARDTSEPVFVAALLAAFLALRDRRPVLAAVAVGVAVFTREQGLFALAALFVAAWWATDDSRPRVRRLAAPAAVAVAWVGWQAFLTARWGDVPVLSGPPNGGLPFAGVLGIVRKDLGAGTGHEVPLLIVAVLLAAAAPLWADWRPPSSLPALATAVRAVDAVALTWATSLLLTVCLTKAVWVDPNAFVRATADVTSLAVVLLFAPGARRWAAPASLVVLLAVTAYLVGQRVSGL